MNSYWIFKLLTDTPRESRLTWFLVFTTTSTMRCDIALHCFLHLPKRSAGSSLLVTSVVLSRVVLNCTCLGNAWFFIFFHLPIALLIYVLLQFYIPKDICTVVRLEKPLFGGLREKTALPNHFFHRAPVLCITSLGYLPGYVFMQVSICFDRTWIDELFFSKSLMNAFVSICSTHVETS